MLSKWVKFQWILVHKNCLYKIIKFNKSCQKVYRLWLHTLFQLEVILMSPSLLLRKSPIDFKSWQRTEWMHQHRISTAVSERGCSRCESSTQVVHISFIVMKFLYLKKKKSTGFYCCISCVLSICLYLFLLHKVSKIHGRVYVLVSESYRAYRFRFMTSIWCTLSLDF